MEQSVFGDDRNIVMDPAAEFLKINISQVLETNLQQFNQFVLFFTSVCLKYLYFVINSSDALCAKVKGERVVFNCVIAIVQFVGMRKNYAVVYFLFWKAYLN